HGSMGESAVVRHSRPQRTRAREAETPQEYFPSRIGEQRDSDDSENVDGDDVNERPSIRALDVPPRKCPRMTFAKPRAGLCRKIAPAHRPKRPERPPKRPLELKLRHCTGRVDTLSRGLYSDAVIVE